MAILVKKPCCSTRFVPYIPSLSFSKKYRSYYHVCSILLHSIVITWSCGMWMWSFLNIVCIWNCNKISWIVYSYLFIYCSHENIVYGFYLGPLFYCSEFCCLSSWCFSCNVIRLLRSYKVYGVGVSYYLKCQYWVAKSEEDKYHKSLSDISVPTMFSWNYYMDIMKDIITFTLIDNRSSFGNNFF
jgi:hypothetical protein